MTRRVLLSWSCAKAVRVDAHIAASQDAHAPFGSLPGNRSNISFQNENCLVESCRLEQSQETLAMIAKYSLSLALALVIASCVTPVYGEGPLPVLQFPSNPSAEEISRARIFEEPLVPIGGEPQC
jgi:hypothetical protein